MKVHVSLYELDNREKSISFPVPPESLPKAVGGKAETVEIVGAGERIIFGGSKLSTFNLESFFPKVADASYTVEMGDKLIAPEKAITQLEAWIELERPLYLYSKEGNLAQEVIITNLSFERERAGHVGDIWFTLDLKEYKAPSYRTVAIKETNSGNSGNGGSKVPEKKATAPTKDALPVDYVVKFGDTLFTIAQKHYGKNDYQRIYEANQRTILLENMKRFSTNTLAIYPGQVLTIPKKEEAVKWSSRVTTQRRLSD